MNTLNYISDYLGRFGFIEWVLLIGALVGAIWKFKSARGRVIAVAVILGLFAAFPGRWEWEVQQRVDHYRTAEAMFQERCKKSGEFIHRTEENVEGILLMKMRPSEINYGDQYRMDDPYGRDLGGDGYIESFIRGEFQATHTGIGRPGSPQYIGYLYVDVLDPKDGQRYRYTGRMDEPWKTNPRALEGHRVFVFDKTLAPEPAPRYGVTYDDISTREERDYWIAGSSLKVIDLQTNEVMAERIGYMMDREQGATGGGRSPWLLATNDACPVFSDHRGSTVQPYQTLVFVEKVLHTIQEK